MYQRALTYYATARDFLGQAAATGRHFLGHLDTAVHHGFQIAQAARPIIAEAANLYAGQRTKQRLGRAQEGIEAAQAAHGRVRQQVRQADALAGRMHAVMGGY